tara:strand:+ start:3438 stop:3650 length:213 start_codon:yes stop_codon:yes gene_type:complete
VRWQKNLVINFRNFKHNHGGTMNEERIFESQFRSEEFNYDYSRRKRLEDSAFNFDEFYAEPEHDCTKLFR